MKLANFTDGRDESHVASARAGIDGVLRLCRGVPCEMFSRGVAAGIRFPPVRASRLSDALERARSEKRSDALAAASRSVTTLTHVSVAHFLQKLLVRALEVHESGRGEGEEAGGEGTNEVAVVRGDDGRSREPLERIRSETSP